MRLVASVVTRSRSSPPRGVRRGAPGRCRSWTQPAIPVEGQAFELLAGGAAAGVSFSWDLDGDGVYGDAAGATRVTGLPAGTRTVSVRATDRGGRHEHGDALGHRGHERWPAAVDLGRTSRMEIDRQYDLATSGASPNGTIVKIEFDLEATGPSGTAVTLRNSWRNEWVGVDDREVRPRGRPPGQIAGDRRQGRDRRSATITVRVAGVRARGHCERSPASPSTSQPVAGQPATIAGVQPPRGREVRVRPRRRRRLRARQAARPRFHAGR